MRAGAAVAVALAAALFAAASGPEAAREDERRAMVEEQLEARGIEDERVLEAMRRVPRHLFVPEAVRPQAYADSALPIGHGQTISQPYVVAAMTEAARIAPGERVLEVGTGSGYGAAVLAELGARVVSVEILPELAEGARERLAAAGYEGVTVVTGDGRRGVPEEAPFDAILVTAGSPEIPEPLLEQLREGGRLVMPVGGGLQELVVVERRAEGFERRRLFPVRFVPLTGGGEEGARER